MTTVTAPARPDHDAPPTSEHAAATPQQRARSAMDDAARARFQAATAAPRQRAGSVPLPAHVVRAIRELRDAEPRHGQRGERAMATRARLDAYLAALIDADWPSGALCAAYGCARATISRRVTRARRQGLRADPGLPVPRRPESRWGVRRKGDRAPT